MTNLANADMLSSKVGLATNVVASAVRAPAMGSKLGGLVLLPKIDADGMHRCVPYAYVKAVATSGWSLVVLNSSSASSLICNSS